MVLRLCKCGALVNGKCPTCHPYRQHRTQTTAERGYDDRWRRLSERKRAADPLCERCLDEGNTTPATEVHHIHKISDAPHLRLAWDNLMSVCVACHKVLDAEGTPPRGWVDCVDISPRDLS